jgi:hypothetical protein
MLNLTACRRSDKKLFDLVYFDNITNVKSSDFNITTNFDNDIHICYANEVRKLINNIKMNQLARKTKKCLKLSTHKNCSKSQDVKLNVNLPVISKINNEKMKGKNNQRFTIIKLIKQTNS